MNADQIVHIVDDDEPVRASLAWLLSTAGISARLYPSAEQFLTETGGRPAGCVLLDIRMPDLDGMDVLKKLALHGPTAPVIIMTGHGDSIDAAEARAFGAAGFIEKPFTADRLFEAIEQATATARQVKEPG